MNLYRCGDDELFELSVEEKKKFSMFVDQQSLFEVGGMKFWFPTIAMDRKSHQLRGPPACHVEEEFFVCDEKSVLNLKGHD